MPRYKMVVLSHPVEGREAEFHDWYQNVHLDQVLACKGFKSAQRFRLARNMMPREAWPHLAIYEIETDDIDAVLDEVRGKAGGESLLISAAIDTESAYASIYEEVDPRVAKK